MSQSEDFKQRYKIKDKLGEGAFAVVKRCTNKADGKDYAVKIIDKSKLSSVDVNFAHSEVLMMKDIDHEHCIKLFEVFETDDHIYIVMEILEGGELFDRIVQEGSFSEQDAANLVRQVAGALKYLHSVGVVHRDLKPENLIYDSRAPDAKLKITDFGLAKYQPDDPQLMSTACGSPAYAAPEILRGEHYDGQVDMWSLGVILYIMLCAFPPFVGRSNQELFVRIKKAKYSFPDPEWTHISAEAKNLVKGLLTLDPKKRLTPDMVLQHEWITSKVSTEAFPEQQLQRLARIQAKKNFRAGVKTVIAIGRMQKGSSSPTREAVADPPSAPSETPAVSLPKMLRQLTSLVNLGKVTESEKADLKKMILSWDRAVQQQAAVKLDALESG